MRRVTIGALAFTLALGVATPAVLRSEDPRPGHVFITPAEVGLAVEGIEGAREAIRREIRRGGMPGATLAVGRGAALVLEEGFGRVGWSSTTDRVDPDRTIYDLASLTKVVATTAAAMLLYEDGKLDLDDAVSAHLPEFPHRRVTFRHLLTHTSGLPAGLRLRNVTPAQARVRILRTPLQRDPGTEVDIRTSASSSSGTPLRRWPVNPSPTSSPAGSTRPSGCARRGSILAGGAGAALRRSC